MKPIVVSFRLAWFAFGLVSIGSNACAQFGEVEGHATLDVLLVNGQTMLCLKCVSGAEDELFALDSNARTVRWRQAVKASRASAVADTNDAFYMFAREFLQKRDLRTGKMIWETRLDSIPQQKTVPKPTLSERWRAILATLQGGSPLPVLTVPAFRGTPNRYAYEPVLSGSSMVVFRAAMSGSGCVIERCFNDWLMFNQNTGQQTSAGSGERLGEAGSSLLVDDASGFGVIRNGQFRDFSIDGLNSSQFHNWFRHLGGPGKQYSWNGRCVFKRNGNEMEEIFVYDAQKSKVDSFKLPVVAAFQVNWVLLDSNLLRYAECPAYSSDGKKNRVVPWFELYDLKGKLIARRETGALTNEHWFYSFLGTSPTNTVHFRDGDGRLIVETPSLRLRTSRPAHPSKRSEIETLYASWHMDRGSRVLYEVQGNTTVHKMPGPHRKHMFRVKAVEANTGLKLWEYVEPTMIKKIVRGTR